MIYPLTFSIKLKPWRSDLSQERAWREASPRLIDFAIELYKTYSNDKWGLLCELISDARFLEITGAEKSPILDPGLHTLGRRSVHNEKRELYFSYQAACTYLRNALLEFLPDSLLEPLKDRYDSLASASTAHIFESLSQSLGVLNAEDLRLLRAEISAPYIPGQSIRTILAEQVTRNLRILGENGQPLSNFDAVAAIKSKFNPVTFEECWKDYARTNGPVLSQTPESLIAAIITHVNERMNTGSPVPDVALSATKSSDPFLHQMTESMSALAASVVQLQAQIAATHLPKPSKPACYCWTHGPSGHNSKDCRSRALGHQENATAKHKMGGREAKWRDKRV